MTTVNAIKHNIVQVLSKVSNLQKVYEFERVPPEGFPAAFVTMNDNANEFHSTSENMRSFSFKIRILVQFGQKVGIDASTNPNYSSELDALEDAERVLGDTVSAVLDALDDAWTLNGIADGGSMAAPSAWSYIQWEGGQGRLAEINLEVRKIHSVDVSSGG